MFSTNGKISARQVKRMLTIELFGLSALVLPLFALNLDGRDFLFAFLLGILLVTLLTAVVLYLARHMKGNFSAYVKRRLGTVGGMIFGAVLFAYCFLTFLYVLRLFGDLGTDFVLREESPYVLMTMAAVAAFFLAQGELQIRSRVSEVFYPVLMYPILALILFAAFHMDAGYLAPGTARIDLETLSKGGEMVIPFGMLVLFLLLKPYVHDPEKGGRAVSEGVTFVLWTLLILFVVLIGTFGGGGVRSLPYPAVTLMSSTEIPGGFLQRWDVIFTGLLMTGLFLSAGACLSYMKLLAKPFLRRGKERNLTLALCILGLLAAFLAGNYEKALQLYQVLGGRVLLPLEILFLVLLWIIERTGSRRERQGGGQRDGEEERLKAEKREKVGKILGIVTVTAVCGLVLSGCSGRELEDRKFSSVVVVPSEDIEARMDLLQQQSSQFLDYGHVKAILLYEEVAKDPIKLEEVLLYFQEHPEFAQNILVFAGGEKELKVARENSRGIGDELGDLYKNQPKGKEALSADLKDLLNFIFNEEPEIRIPVVSAAGEKLILDGSITVLRENS